MIRLRISASRLFVVSIARNSGNRTSASARSMIASAAYDKRRGATGNLPLAQAKEGGLVDQAVFERGRQRGH
jgi:hypothetical protein